ncbi:hypothetical protein TI03_00175, partial [Achromatium sp. WMS1]
MQLQKKQRLSIYSIAILLAFIVQDIIAADATSSGTESDVRQLTTDASGQTPNTSPADDDHTSQLSPQTENHAKQQRMFQKQRLAAKQAYQARKRAALRKHWATRLAQMNARYKKLRRQAAADGVVLPDVPPWHGSAHGNLTTVAPDFPPYSPEEPVTPPPASNMSYPPVTPDSETPANQPNLEQMQAIIDGMTPEERDVCTTVHRLSMGLTQHSRA